MSEEEEAYVLLIWVEDEDGRKAKQEFSFHTYEGVLMAQQVLLFASAFSDAFFRSEVNGGEIVE